MAYFWLTPPSRAVFSPLCVSCALGTPGVKCAHASIPVVNSYTFETLLVAFLLLLAGNLYRGL